MRLFLRRTCKRERERERERERDRERERERDRERERIWEIGGGGDTISKSLGSNSF